MTIIAVIPARGGSKGIPRKNLKFINGKPLITYSILDAKESELVNQVFVSTDDLEIAEVAQQYGAEIIMRPLELANDVASSESVLLHALTEIKNQGIIPELIVFLQCTCPIRTSQDIDQAIIQFKAKNADSLLSVSLSHRFLWENIDGIGEPINYDYRSRPRRQDMKPQYVENGSIYIFKPWVLKELNNRLGGEISLFLMQEEANIDIDSLIDFKIAEFFLKGE
jgi:CMP-N,N'-diacetyllegionaminic acid synthase